MPDCGARFAFLRRQAFGCAIVGCAAAAYFWPEAFISWFGVKLTSTVGPVIQLIMFGMGTTLSVDDFLRVAKMPWSVAAGVVLQFIVMPLVGLGLAKAFNLEPDLAAGVVLVGSVAGGTASNVVAYLAHANVALSVSMTCVSTLLSPFLTPFIMQALAGQYVAVDTWAMMKDLLVLVMSVGAGLLVHTVFRRLFDRHKKVCDTVLSGISMTGICATILFITAAAHDKLVTTGAIQSLFAVAILHNTTGFVGGYWFARLLGRFLPIDRRDCRTVAIEVGMQNGGMAAKLAWDVLGRPLAAVPANMFSIWMNFAGSMLANWWGRTGKKDARTEGSGA